jgi:hypothetical protein
MYEDGFQTATDVFNLLVTLRRCQHQHYIASNGRMTDD